MFTFLICSAVPQVSIETHPSAPPYPAATYIHSKCNVETSLSVLYNWTILCTSQGSNQVVSRFPNLNNPGVFSLRSLSTPTHCQDTVLCTVVDSVGNTAEASVRIDNITGEPNSGASRHTSIPDTGSTRFAPS